MSNQVLGNIYTLIMNDVIDSCQTTFEEDGVNQQTLEEMRTTWQRRLTGLHVGQFPWEPAPAPQPMPGPMSNPTVPSNVPRSGNSAATSTGEEAPVRVKQESNYDSSYQTNGLPPNYGNNVARERAAQNLQQKFGPEAAVQINRLQAQAAMNLPSGQSAQRSSAGGQYPQSSQMTDKQRADIAEYHRQAAQSQGSPRPPTAQQPQAQPVVNNARTDGADEWDTFVAERRQASADPHEADLTIRQMLEQAQKANEGGGLLLPASEQTTGSKAGIKSSGVSQVDGVDDDDEDEDSKADIKDELFDDDANDADAINSDLDDPDDNAIEEEQDEGRPNQIMLCTYDKVQRVKNKWKCILKDGVLNTGGKDYVFTKATGEFEW